MHLVAAWVLRIGRQAKVAVITNEDGREVRRRVHFNNVKSASHVELVRRACRMVGGTPLQRQVTRRKVKGVWVAPKRSDAVKATAGNAIQEDEQNGTN